MSDKAMTRIIAAVIAAIIVLVTIWQATAQVGPGEVGVVTTLGNPSGITLGSGFPIKLPYIRNVTAMSVRQQLYNLTGSTDLTADRQTFYTDVAVNYRVDSKDVSQLFTTVGPDYVDVAIAPAVEGTLHTVVSQHTAVDLISDLPSVLMDYQNALQSKVDQDNIQILNVYFPNNHFDTAYQQSILAAQVAQQNLIRAGYEQQQRVIVSRTDANVANIKAAQGLANARISQAHWAMRPRACWKHRPTPMLSICSPAA